MKIAPIETARLIVREFTLADREALLTFAREPEQLKFMMFSLKSEAEVDTYLAMAIEQSESADRLFYHLAIEEKNAAQPVFIGSVDLMMEGENPTEAELGYFFVRGAWGKGYATEASAVALELGLVSLGLHRVWGKCHSLNVGSARVMTKLGMKHEGTLREHHWMGDHWRSSEVFGILDREWKAGTAKA